MGLHVTLDELPKTEKSNVETVISIPKELTLSNSPELDPNLVDERESWVVGVDLKNKFEKDQVCRICHLDCLEEDSNPGQLIRLGCGCKGELSFAHSCCSEAWFKIKGNRKCEICGEIVSNVKGTDKNEEFIKGWMEGRVLNDSAPNSSLVNRRCLHAQSFCNFLIACLVLAFILPWFLRVSLFDSNG